MDRLKRSLISPPNLIFLPCCNKLHSRILSDNTSICLGCSRSWKVILDQNPSVMCGCSWSLLTCISLYLKPQTGKFPSLVQPIRLSLNHKLYFSILQSEKISSSSMIIKSVDQILPFTTNVQILLKSAELKGMQLWAECVPTFFPCWIFITWHLSDSSGLHNKGRVAQFG